MTWLKRNEWTPFLRSCLELFGMRMQSQGAAQARRRRWAITSHFLLGCLSGRGGIADELPAHRLAIFPGKQIHLRGFRRAARDSSLRL